MADTSMIDVERLGGFGGFGLPGSRIRSHGKLALSSLSTGEREALDAHLHSPRPAPGGPVADGFRYRITWRAAEEVKTLELPEALVPAALCDCVRDELV